MLFVNTSLIVIILIILIFSWNGRNDINVVILQVNQLCKKQGKKQRERELPLY